MPVMNKEMPEINEETKEVPKARRTTKATPQEAELNKAQPEARELNKPVPPIVHPENVITIGGQAVEIKPTKLIYQRNRTAAAYHILETYPLPDILAMDKGILDPERDGDAILFDFLTAVFDDGKLVAKYYDSLTTEEVERAVKIFKRLNHIEDKEEAAKNRAAKGTTN